MKAIPTDPLKTAIQCFSPSNESQGQRASEAIELLVAAYRKAVNGVVVARPGLKPYLERLQLGVSKLDSALSELRKEFPEALPLLSEPSSMDQLNSFLARLNEEVVCASQKPVKPGLRANRERSDLIWQCYLALAREGAEPSSNGKSGSVPRLALAVHELAIGKPATGQKTWGRDSDRVIASFRRLCRSFPGVGSVLDESSSIEFPRKGCLTLEALKQRLEQELSTDSIKEKNY